MVDAAKAFAAEPPRRPLTSLDAIVEDFQWRYVDRKKTDQVIAFCKSAPNLRIAIRRAVRSRDAQGKHHNHQSKVDITARMDLGEALIHSRSEIRHIVAYGAGAKDWEDDMFDLLHDHVVNCSGYGIGPVTVYDVAVRVGAFLNIEPTKVYVHAGVRKGLIALENAYARLDIGPVLLTGAHKLPRVPMYLFPEPLVEMRADDVEDILCTYREVFDTWHV